MQKSIVLYIKYLTNVKRRADKTIQNYELYLRRFLAFAKARQINFIEELDEQKVQKYKQYLQKKKYNNKTINYHLIALRGFLKYLLMQKHACLCPTRVKLKQVEHKPVAYAGEKELSDLLEAPLKSELPRLIQVRDKAVLVLLICTGLRVSEIAILTKENIDFKKSELRIIQRKQERVLNLSNQAKHWLEKYLQMRKDDLPYLFISHDKATEARVNKKIQKGLSARSIERIVKKYAQSAGIDKEITPHSLRRNFVKKMLMQGKSTLQIQNKIGNISKNFLANY